MFDGTKHCPVSMAVGDFDGDGYKNEVVVVWSDTAAVYFTVRQLNYDNGGFSLKRLGGGRVHEYDYENRPDHSYTTLHCLDEYKARGQNMDGLMGSYSYCVVAGDFDGKGKDEFAVVWRDVQPQDGNFTSGSYSSKQPQWYGYTGRIHVETYKWDPYKFALSGNKFITQEDVQAYDKYNLTYDSRASFIFGWWVDSDAPIGVKAAVGDFDGDGRDELAVLRVMLQWSKYGKYNDPERGGIWKPYDSNLVFGAFVDLYTFKQGSITPEYHAHSTNYGSNGNGWVGFRTDSQDGKKDMAYIELTDYSNFHVDQERPEVVQFFGREWHLKPVTGQRDPYPHR